MPYGRREMNRGLGRWWAAVAWLGRREALELGRPAAVVFYFFEIEIKEQMHRGIGEW